MALTKTRILIRDSARAFARENLAPNAAAWDRESRYPREAIDAMGALGLRGMLVPEEFDGAAGNRRR